MRPSAARSLSCAPPCCHTRRACRAASAMGSTTRAEDQRGDGHGHRQERGREDGADDEEAPHEQAAPRPRAGSARAPRSPPSRMTPSRRGHPVADRPASGQRTDATTPRATSAPAGDGREGDAEDVGPAERRLDVHDPDHGTPAPPARPATARRGASTDHRAGVPEATTSPPRTIARRDRRDRRGRPAEQHREHDAQGRRQPSATNQAASAMPPHTTFAVTSGRGCSRRPWIASPIAAGTEVAGTASLWRVIP